MRFIRIPGFAAALFASVALAHGDHDPGKGHLKPPPVAILQLDQVRDATAKYFDVDAAVKAGYVDIGLFVPKAPATPARSAAPVRERTSPSATSGGRRRSRART